MRHLILAFAALALSGCAVHTLKPFTTDGCSLYPDGTEAAPQEWRDCCVTHDIAYWQGGTRKQRLAADESFRACVVQRSEDPGRAARMFHGVRAGGSAALPTPFRWGYGWGYGRGYEPLNAEERAQVRKLAPGGG